jgi:hypothetical protein
MKTGEECSFMSPKKDNWYYEVEGERFGPYSKAIISKNEYR